MSYYGWVGKDIWGAWGPPSEPARLDPCHLVYASPEPLLCKEINPGRLELRWDLAEQHHPSLSAFEVYRARERFGPFEKMATLPSSQRVLILDTPWIPAYYQVYAVYAADQYYGSMVSLGTVWDLEPPAVPERLKAVLDTTTMIVTLTWDPVLDADLKGYRVSFAHGAGGHKFLLNNLETPYPTIQDTLGKYDIYTDIYYWVTARDYHQNESFYSDSVFVELPDVFPPVAARITALEPETYGVRIFYDRSPSADVAEYFLQKRTGTDTAVLDQPIYPYDWNNMVFDSIRDLTPQSYRLKTVDRDSIYLGGAYQNTAGVYTDVYISIFGCDSTVVTTLGIKAIATNTLTPITICDNDSALIFGNYQTVAGMYSTVIPTGAVNGCDSIVYQELIVNPTYQIFANATICSGDSIFLGGAYQTTAGVYVDVYTSSLGCDSTITTTLNVINSFTININDTICVGDSILLAGAYQTVAGTYTELLVSSGGCDSLVITELYVNPLPIVTLTADPELILSGQSSQLTATGGVLYSWTPTTGLSCSNCDSPVASPTETTLYTVEVNLNGCMVSDTVTISVDSVFKIPEGFSPNGDGVNDVFEIVGIGQFPNNKIKIVNRWGDKVFEAAPYKSDWDGTSQFGLTIGEKLPSGAYFYVLDLGKVGPSGSQEIKGYIYINR